jgi:hypothetical protein
MRRAQGATLDLVGLYFDRKRPDRGYAYVGTSRAKRRGNVYHVGGIRRTDWLPVGGDDRGNEQEYLSVLSDSDSEEPSDDEDEWSMSEFSEDDAETAAFAWRHLDLDRPLHGPDVSGLMGEADSDEEQQAVAWGGMDLDEARSPRHDDEMGLFS